MSPAVVVRHGAIVAKPLEKLEKRHLHALTFSAIIALVRVSSKVFNDEN